MKQKNEKLDLPRSKENIENYFQTKFILHILRNPIYIKLNDVELDLTKRPLINKPTELDLHLLNFNRIVEFENIKDDIYRIVIECIDYDKDPNTYNIEVETEIPVKRYIAFLENERQRISNMPDVGMKIPSIDYIDKELEEYKEEETETKALKTLKNNYNENLTLLDLFESVSKYNYIMNLLADKGYCQPNTYIWKDEMKGNKGLLAAIIKYLHKQGYYKNNKKPTNEQIILIAKNTFGWELKIDTVKRTNPNNFDLSFIPQSSTIN